MLLIGIIWASDFCIILGNFLFIRHLREWSKIGQYTRKQVSIGIHVSAHSSQFSLLRR